MDNSHGKGYMGVDGFFVIMENCPMHYIPKPERLDE